MVRREFETLRMKVLEPPCDTRTPNDVSTLSQ